MRDIADTTGAAIEVEAHVALDPGEFRLAAGSTETDGRLRAMLAAVLESLAEECTAEEDAG